MVKLAILLFGYVIAAPIVGLMARRVDWLRCALFFGLVLLTGLPQVLLEATPGNIIWYRGHASGYSFSIQIMAAIALLIACWRGSSELKPARWIILSYTAWIALSALSIFHGTSIELGLMALWNYWQPLLVFLAAFLYFRQNGNRALALMTIALSIGLCFQIPLVLEQKLIGHADRAWGSFVHSNNLGMWAYLAGIPILGVALANRNSPKFTAIALIPVGAAGISILMSVSRAAIVIYAFACVFLIVTYWLITRSKRSGIAALAILLMSAIGGIIVGPKVSERFKDGDYLGESDLRTALNTMSRAMLHDSPLTGVGWNNAGLVNSRPYPKYSPILEKWSEQQLGYTDSDPRNYRRNPLPESVWWLTLGETGYLGLAGLLALITVSYLVIIRAAFAQPASSPWQWLFICIALAISLTYVHTFIERILICVPPVTTLWLIYVAAARARQLLPCGTKEFR